MVMSPAGLGSENDSAGEAGSNCKRQTRPFVSMGASHQQTRNCLAVKKNLVFGSRWALTPRQTDRLTVRRNINLTLTREFSQSEE
jgi:hypothetical protein